MPGGGEYGLLGPLIVRRAGAAVQVAPGKQRVVLAALLLRGGREAGLGELAEALWGGQPPPSAKVTIQNYVGRLRRALGDGAGAVIVTGPGGYRIVTGPGELDTDRFEAALAAGRAAAGAGDWARAARLLRGGLALWRGEPLTGIDSEVLALRDGLRLAELRWQATEELAEAELRLGRHREVIAGLRQATAEQPLRERLHALLMTALYRDGQQGAALAAYRAGRAALAAGLGTGPGPELRELHQQILNADPSGVGCPSAGPRPAARARAAEDRPEARYALPPDIAAFTGRAAELDAVTAGVRGGALAIRAIGGMPGVGKTALAVHAAHRLADQFPDRQLLIDLHGHTPGQSPVPPADALAGLLSATGVDPRALPGDLAGRAALWRDRMAGQKALLVLDNAASSAQVAPLLPGAAGCLVLVTSRRHLGDLPGAVVPVRLEALPPARAAEMFLRLAPRAVAPAAAEAVAELTALAGFLPLAISVLARACGRHPARTVAGLAAETRASLLALAAGPDSVAAALEISYRHLPPGRQRFFRALGLHPGTTTEAHAAAALAGIPPDQAAAHLDALHGEGLLTETGYRRYGMHDLIRRYARDLAAADPAASRDQAVTRLLDYYAGTALAADRHLAHRTRPAPPPAAAAAAPDLPDRAAALAWMRAERAGLLACIGHAAAHGQPERVIALTAAMAAFLDQEGPWPQAAALHQAAAAAARRRGDGAGEAGALHDLGRVRRMSGDYPAAAGALEQALAICTGRGDLLGAANALWELGRLRHLTGDYQGAIGLREQALTIYTDLGDRPGEASTLRDLGRVRYVTGDYPAAAGLLERALVICADLGDQLGEAGALGDLGLVRRMTGDYPAAAGLLERALAIYTDLGSRLGEAGAAGDLGLIRRMAGDYPAAAGLAERALAIYTDLGSRHGQASALHDLGSLATLTGDYPAAARLLEQSAALFREVGDPQGEAQALSATGALLARSAGPAAALGAYQQALRLARQVRSPRDEADALAGLGRCAAAGGDAARAAALLREALAIYEQLGAAEASGLAAELAALASR